MKPEWFHFEHGNGWFDLIWDMSKKIYENMGDLEKDGYSISILQIKEKFGELRIYYGFKRDRNEVFDIDVIIIGRNIARDRIVEIIKQTANKSLNTCEDCGIAGELRNNKGWDRCQCNNCFFIYNLKREIRDIK
jgi:hypothetical protein